MEKRRSRRHRVRIGVRVEPGLLASSTADVSATGLFLRSARVLAPGTPVSLALLTPFGPAWAEGVVRWGKRVPQGLLPYTRGGIGIEFTRLSPELARYLQGLSGEVVASVS